MTTDVTRTAERRVERPSGADEAAALLRDTTGSVLLRGAGTQLGWCGTVRDPDLVVSTEAMTGVLAHEPADMTAVVAAGTPLAVVQEELGAHGQWLAYDPPTAVLTPGGGASVGGLLAAGDAGPSRLGRGTLRDLVIGVTLVLADGTVAHSGGRVIKNVAGYDLAKLVHGSLGSLALVTEVVLRLHPRPQTSRTLVGAAHVSQAAAAATRLSASPLEPAAVEWVEDADGDAGRLLVRVDGSPLAVEDAAGRLSTLLRETGVALEAVDDDEAARAWREHAACVDGDDGATVVRLSTLPSDLLVTARHVAETAERLGVDARTVSGVALGLHTVSLTGGTPEARAEVVHAVRDAVVERGGSAQLRRRPDDVDAVVDALGPPPSAVALLRRVKEQFDLSGRLAPGRFAPWY